MRVEHYDTFHEVIDALVPRLAKAPAVDVGEWQAITADIPQARTIELEDVSFGLMLPKLDVTELQRQVEPNLPWAEDHFQERISGIPYNPPPSSDYWPFATAKNDAFKSEEKFSHTYPERMWPKWTVVQGKDWGSGPQQGIRYPWGDLEDVVKLLRERPGTRQAYLPIWFPEDTGAVAGQRVPCTLGYHFLVRNGYLKIVYYIRSCDYYRHFRDDVYMAARLAQWVGERVNATPDRLVMHISSLHIFEAERKRIEEEVGALRYQHSEAIRHR